MLRRSATWFLGLCLFALAQPAYGQRLFVLVAVDLSPAAKWGVYAPNLSMDFLRMQGFFEQNAPRRLMQLETLFMDRDADSSPQRILAELRKFEPSPEDAVVFYFTGHGGFDERGSYFELAGGKLYREEVRGLISSKRPRLSVLLTDCCNSRSDGNKMMAGAPFYEPLRNYTPLFKSLFVDPAGIVDINSSAPGQSAFFLPNPDEDGDKFGSIFTTALADWAEKHQQRSATWDELVREVSLKVHTTFKQAYPTGAKGAKGGFAQADQDVYAPVYPGIPEKRGLRAGIYVTDNDGQSVRISSLDPDSPATVAYDPAKDEYVPVPVGGVITSVNGQGVSDIASFQAAVKNSSKVMLLKVVRNGITKDYFICLRY